MKERVKHLFYNLKTKSSANKIYLKIQPQCSPCKSYIKDTRIIQAKNSTTIWVFARGHEHPSFQAMYESIHGLNNSGTCQTQKKHQGEVEKRNWRARELKYER